MWDQLDRVHRVLLLTAQAFDVPGPTYPAKRYVGPVLDDPGWAAGAPARLPPGDEPLVLVGSPTSRTRGAEGLLRSAAAALAELPVRAVVSTGPALAPFPSPRPGVVVVRAAPHSRLLPSAAAVVTHGGHGTVVRALAAGCPVLVLPLGRDQPDNAARVVWHGAGLRLPARAGRRRIASAVRTLTSDPRYRAAALALGQRIRAEADSGRVVAEVEAAAGE